MNNRIKMSVVRYKAQRLIQERVNQLTIGEYYNYKRLLEQQQDQLPPPQPPMDPNMMMPHMMMPPPAAPPVAPPPMDPNMMVGAPPMDPMAGGAPMGPPPMDPSMGMGPPPAPAGPKKLKIFQEELPDSLKKLLKLPEYVLCKHAMKYGTNAVMNCIERIDHSKKIND